MKIKPLKTQIVTAGNSLEKLLASSIDAIEEQSILVITSKVVALCQGRTLPVDKIKREDLIVKEAELYYEADSVTKDYRYHFAIKHDTLIPAAGIDASNADGNYVIWPEDPIKTSREIRKYLCSKFGVNNLGVIICDSTIGLSRWGTLGIAIGHSGFKAVKGYVGRPDLFGRVMGVSKANVAGGLAAAGVVTMGEGAEQTPIALIEDIPFVEFDAASPSTDEVEEYYVSPLHDEPFIPFFTSVDWKTGGSYKHRED